MSRICRSCLKPSQHFYSIYTDSFPVENLFRRLVPEVCLFTSGEPVICKSCYELLEMVDKFRVQCLQTEKLINKYLSEIQTTEIDFGKVELHDVVSYWNTIYYAEPYRSDLPREDLFHLVGNQGLDDGEIYVRQANPSEIKTIVRPTIRSPVDPPRTVKNLPENFQGNNNDKYMPNTWLSSWRIPKKSRINRDPLMQKNLFGNKRLEDRSVDIENIDGQKLLGNSDINIPSTENCPDNLSERENNEKPSGSTSIVPEKSPVVEPRIRVRSAASLFEARTLPSTDITNTEHCKIGYISKPKTTSVKEDLPRAANITDPIENAHLVSEPRILTQASLAHFKIPKIPPIRRKTLKRNRRNNGSYSNDVLDVIDSRDVEVDQNPILPVLTTNASLTSLGRNQFRDIENLVAQFAPSECRGSTENSLSIQGEPQLRSKRERPDEQPPSKRHKKNPKEQPRDSYCIPPIECTARGDYANDHDYLRGPYDINDMRIKRSKGYATWCLLCDTTQAAHQHQGHLRKHDTQCMICDVNFENVFLLNMHAREHFEHCSSCNETVTYAQFSPHLQTHLSLYDDAKQKTPVARVIKEGEQPSIASCDNKQKTEFSTNGMQSDSEEILGDDDMEFISLTNLCDTSNESPLINHVYLNEPQTSLIASKTSTTLNKQNLNKSNDFEVSDDEIQSNETVILAKDKAGVYEHCESSTTTGNIAEMPIILEKTIVTDKKSSSKSNSEGNVAVPEAVQSPNFQLPSSEEETVTESYSERDSDETTVHESAKSTNLQLPSSEEKTNGEPKETSVEECIIEKLLSSNSFFGKIANDAVEMAETIVAANIPKQTSETILNTVKSATRASLKEFLENFDKDSLKRLSGEQRSPVLVAEYDEIDSYSSLQPGPGNISLIVEDPNTTAEASSNATQQSDDDSIKVAPDKSLDKLVSLNEPEKMKIKRSRGRPRGAKSFRTSNPPSSSNTVQKIPVKRRSSRKRVPKKFGNLYIQNIEKTSQYDSNIFNDPPEFFQNSSWLNPSRSSNKLHTSSLFNFQEVPVNNKTYYPLTVAKLNEALLSVYANIRKETEKRQKSESEGSFVDIMSDSFDTNELQPSSSDENKVKKSTGKRVPKLPTKELSYKPKCVKKYENKRKLAKLVSSSNAPSKLNNLDSERRSLFEASLNDALQSFVESIDEPTPDYFQIQIDEPPVGCEGSDFNSSSEKLDTGNSSPQPSTSADLQKENKIEELTGKGVPKLRLSKLLDNPKRVKKYQNKRKLAKLVSSSNLPSKVNILEESFVGSIDEPTPDYFQIDIEESQVECEGYDSNSSSVNILNFPPEEAIQKLDTGNSSTEPQPSSSAENKVEKQTSKRMPKLSTKLHFNKLLDNPKRFKKSQNKRKMAKLVRSSNLPSKVNIFEETFVGSIEKPTPDYFQIHIEEPPVECEGCDSNSSLVNILKDPPEETLQKLDTENTSNEPQTSTPINPQKENKVGKLTGKRVPKLSSKLRFNKLLDNSKRFKKSRKKRRLAKFVRCSNPPSKVDNLEEEPVENKNYLAGRRSSVFLASLNDALQSFVDSIDDPTSDKLQKDIEKPPIGSERCDSNSSANDPSKETDTGNSPNEKQPSSVANPLEENKIEKSTNKRVPKLTTKLRLNKLLDNPKRVKKSQKKRKLAKFVSGSKPPSNVKKILPDFSELDTEQEPSTSANLQKENKLTGKRVPKLPTKLRSNQVSNNPKRVKKYKKKRKLAKLVSSSNSPSKVNNLEEEPVENKNYLAGRRSSLFAASLNEALQSFVDSIDEPISDYLEKDFVQPLARPERCASNNSPVNILNTPPEETLQNPDTGNSSNEPQPRKEDKVKKLNGTRGPKLTNKHRLKKLLDNPKCVKNYSENKRKLSKLVSGSNPASKANIEQSYLVGREGYDSTINSANHLNTEILQNSTELDTESSSIEPPPSTSANLQKETLVKKLPKRLRRLPKKYIQEILPPPATNLSIKNQMRRKSLKQSSNFAEQKFELVSDNKELAGKAKLLENSSHSQVVSESALIKMKDIVQSEETQILSGRKRKRGVLELEARNIAVSEEDEPTLKRNDIQRTATSLIEGTNSSESSGSLNLVEGLRVNATRRSSRTPKKSRKISE
ncbi:unnamed protein product [Ceutorhynchus assimilis]|uniref:C2H2-type domain-containing protein n=1 Tax=Ceutorhynchus assimilis TaxID=467358 RepID=A0A9N9MZ07_9CUCU|nr:unnamed protein product [Ceutorhynchus assimilis]